MTPHINAKDGAFAKTVLMPGDPLRAKHIAMKYLDNVEEVTNVRNILGYTGTYKGTPVSVMASGMGIPSIGIYSWELYSEYGVENIIRIGSAGSYTEKLDVMDVVMATSAYSDSSYALLMSGCENHVAFPSKSLSEAIMKASEITGIACKGGVVNSADVFYSQEPWQDIAARTKADCVEMESFGLFHNASFLGKNAACLLTISDSFVNKKNLTAEERQNSFAEMMLLALETVVVISQAK